MANNYTGMGQATAVRYEQVAGRIGRYLNGANAGRPVNYAPSPPPNQQRMNYVPGNYQLMPNTPPNYQQMYPQMNYGSPMGSPYGYQPQPQYNPMAYGRPGYMPMGYGAAYGMMPGVRVR